MEDLSKPENQHKFNMSFKEWHKELVTLLGKPVNQGEVMDAYEAGTTPTQVIIDRNL